MEEKKCTKRKKNDVVYKQRMEQMEWDTVWSRFGCGSIDYERENRTQVISANVNRIETIQRELYTFIHSFARLLVHSLVRSFARPCEERAQFKSYFT